MNQDTVKQLPAETVKLITSTQIVTSVSTAVKELVENSIDAGAKVIQLRLENYGLDLIEIKDDGSGVSYDNVQKMFLPGYTSKIRQFEDLEQLYSYGFRGEALAAICKVAKVSITTKTNLDTLAMTYEIDPSGLPVSSKPTHLNNGTVITVTSLFSNLPVRRLFLSSKKKTTEELKKTEQVVQSLSLIHPELGVSLIHNKCSIWKKNSVRGIKQSFMQVAGLKIVSRMEHLKKSLNQVNVDLIVPKKNLENVDNLFTNSQHNVYMYVNKRPIHCKHLSQPVQEHIFHHFSNLNIANKYAICLISIETSPQQVDINLEPNKTKILLKNQTEIIKVIDETLSNYYGDENFTCSVLKEKILEEIINDEETDEQPTKKAKLETSGNWVGEKRNKLFKEKNQDWHLEIINEDCAVNSNLDPSSFYESKEPSGPQSLCSQINANNSVLTQQEISEVNTILSETNNKLITSTNSMNSETRLIDRGDIQSRHLEKPVLQEWPCRPKVTIEPSLPIINEFEPKTVEEIAAEIEKSAEEWSSDMLKALKVETNSEKSFSGLEEESEKFDLSMQSISSQMGKRELKAFTKFARIMRPKIIEEFPNIMFTQVAGILAERWKSLTPDEVKYYEKMAEVVDINRKVHQEEKRNEIPKQPEKPAKPSTVKYSKINSLFEQIKKRSKINRPARPETPLEGSLSIVKNLLSAPEPEPPEDEFRIIGHLQPSGNWLYKKGKEIGHVRHQGLQELITFQKMLSNFSVPRKPLDQPILIDEEKLGSVLWNILTSLETNFDPTASKHVVDTDVIRKNGFRVEVDKTGDVITSASVTEVALSIPHFGISELKDTLRMYEKNGECGGLATWRPTSVYNYLTNEAVRTAQQSSKPPNREQIEEMTNTYNLCLKHLPSVCLHSKEIFVPIYQLEDHPPQQANKLSFH